MEKLLQLEPRQLLRATINEGAAFWFVCGYLIVEYVRPQSIYPAIDFLPWGQVFILGCLIFAFRQKKAKQKNAIFGFLLLYLVIIVISGLLAYKPEVSFNYLKDYYIWIIVFYIITKINNNPTRFFLFVVLFILCSFKMSLFGAKTWAMRGFAFADWGIMGPSGHFQNSGELAIQMLVLFALSYYFILAVKEKVNKKILCFLYLIPITSVMTVIGASSRGAQLALVCQLLLIFKWSKLSFKYLVYASLLLFLAWSFFPDEQKQRFFNAGEDKTSQQRLLYWKNGLEMVSKNPVFGVGYFNFVPYFNDFYPEDVLYGNAQLPHNIFVQIATDTGMVGFFVHLVTIFSGFRLTMRVRQRCGSDTVMDRYYSNMSRGLDLSLIGYIVAGQFVTVTYYPFIWVNFALMVCLYNTHRYEYEKS